jgi:membrane fusion protein (multidrug efflux system)
MKKSKRLLIGIIALWVAVFLVIWGITVFRKSPIKKMGVPWVKTEGRIAKDAGIDTGPAATGMPGLKDMAPRSGPASEAIPVRCYRVSLTDFKDELPVIGTVRGALEIELKFEVNGVIESINFREGDMLYKNDLIASLDKKDARLKVDYSKSKLESAKTQFLVAKKKLEIHKNLYEIGGIIKMKLEEVELEVKGAELQIESNEVELASAEAELEKTDLYAPRDGVLGSRDAEVGEFVTSTSQDEIATLYDIMEVFVELGIVEKDIDKIALGQKVSLTVDAHPGMDFTGTVDNVFPVIEGKSRTLTVRVRIKNPDALLLPGMFARAMITVAEFTNAIVVPSISLDKTDEGYKIFMVDENNTVSSRIVDVAYVTTDYTVIASGLHADELVVTDVPEELKDGMSVNIIEIEESSIEE